MSSNLKQQFSSVQIESGISFALLKTALSLLIFNIREFVKIVLFAILVRSFVDDSFEDDSFVVDSFVVDSFVTDSFVVLSVLFDSGSVLRLSSAFLQKNVC